MIGDFPAGVSSTRSLPFEQRHIEKIASWRPASCIHCPSEWRAMLTRCSVLSFTIRLSW